MADKVHVLKITDQFGKVTVFVYSTEEKAMNAQSLAFALGAAVELRQVYMDSNNEGCILDPGRRV